MIVKGRLTREQAVAIAGEEVVTKIENDNCDYTNRLLHDNCMLVEFSASATFVDKDGCERVLVAYYYQWESDLEGCDDHGSLDWEVEGWEVF